MHNRRQTYRHSFPPDEELRVELTTLDQRTTVSGELTDLSVEGMRVRVKANAAPRVGDQFTARLLDRASPPADLGLSFLVQVRHLDRHGADVYCGIHFLPAVQPSLNEQRENALGRFLAEEQRRAIRQLRAAREE